MKTAIMQPYFLPYIGYFQLISAVDSFVVYDNIEYTKKGWINRNRILLDGKDKVITLPLKKDSDYRYVNERFLSESFNKRKIKNQIYNAYNKSPYYKNVIPIIEEIIDFNNNNLFDYIFYSIKKVCAYLGITTPLIISSNLLTNDNLKAQRKVIEICKKLGASQYINPIGGTTLYVKQEFADAGIDLFFLQSQPIEYKQYSNNFIPWLSIIDVMMFNDSEVIQKHLNNYKLIESMK